MITVKHRRADDDEWMNFDPVIPDGEIALVSREHGYDIKIGNGVQRYSELDSIMGKHVTLPYEDYHEITLGHRDTVCMETVYELSVTLDIASHPDYTAMISFDSPEEPTQFILESSMWIRFSGSDTSEGAFIPRENAHYTLLFWRDTGINCHVRGVYDY